MKLRWLVLGIYLISLVARVGYFSRIVTFRQDQARDVFLMEQYVKSGTFLVGYGPKASLGDFYLTPLYYQLHLVVSVITGFHPLAMHWLIILAESATPVVWFLILKRFLDKKAALVASLTYGLGVLPIIFSTFAWNPNLVPLMASLSLWCFLKYVLDDQKKYIVWGSLAAAAAFHFHYQSAVLVPFIAAVGLFSLKRSWKDLKYWLIAVAAVGVTLLPFLWVEATHNWINTQQIFGYFTQEHARYFDRVSKVEFITTFLPAFFERVIFGDATKHLILGRVLWGLSLVGLGWLSLKNKAARWVLVFLGSILLMLRLYKGDKLDYYMSTLFIVPYIGFGVLSHYGKQLGLAIALICIGLGAVHMGKLETRNELNNLKAEINIIETKVGSQKVLNIYHEDDFVNLYTYGLNHYSSIVTAADATLVLDWCVPKQRCLWDQVPICRYNRTYTYAAFYKYTNNYQPKEQFWLNNNLYIQVGEISTPSTKMVYQPYDSSYGSDLLQ